MSKSNLLLFHPPQKKLKEIVIQINGQTIPLKNKTKYLGVIIDNHLTWHDHIQYINLKLSRANGILAKSRHYVPKQLLRTLFYSFFQPHIEYCMNIWTCAPKTTLEPIEISMKKVIRTISFAKFDAHSEPLFKEHNILNFANLLKLQLWELRHGQYPNFLKDNLLVGNVSKAERIRYISQKFIPLSRTLYKAHFVSSSGQTCWRDIPTKIKQCKSKKIFSVYYRKYLLDPKKYLLDQKTKQNKK